MSSTTGEHINELEERRRRRQQRNAAQPGNAKPPRSANTAPEARDLLRDLITNGSPPDETARASIHAGSVRATEAARTVRSRRSANRQAGGSAKRRRVDELVRRVQAGAQTVADGGRTRDSPRSPHRHRRPFGRRGNPEPSATASRPPCRRSHSHARSSPSGVPRWRPRPPSSIAGVVLALSLDSAGGRRAATTHSAPILATAAGPASAMRTTISTIDRELDGAGPSSNGSGPSRPTRDQARARPTAAASRANDAGHTGDTKPAGPRRVASDNIVSDPDIHATAHPQTQAGRQQAERRPVPAAPTPQARPTRARSAGSAPASAAAPNPTKGNDAAPSTASPPPPRRHRLPA